MCLYTCILKISILLFKKQNDKNIQSYIRARELWPRLVLSWFNFFPSLLSFGCRNISVAKVIRSWNLLIQFDTRGIFQSFLKTTPGRSFQVGASILLESRGTLRCSILDDRSPSLLSTNSTASWDVESLTDQWAQRTPFHSFWYRNFQSLDIASRSPSCRRRRRHRRTRKTRGTEFTAIFSRRNLLHFIP